MKPRHLHKISFSKPEVVRWHPQPSEKLEIQDWGVELRFTRKIGVNGCHTNVESPLIISDLKRLRRVINRAIKVLKNHGKNNPKRC